MELWNAITDRCSARIYENRKMGKAELDALLIAGSLAPVGMGQYENIHFTVVTNDEILEMIDKAAAKKMGKEDAHPIYGAPTLIIVSSRPGKFVIPGIKELNCGCILENMMLAATDAGLGSVFLLAATDALREDSEIMSKLNIPGGFTPVGTLGVGYTPMEAKAKEKTIRVEVDFVE